MRASNNFLAWSSRVNIKSATQLDWFISPKKLFEPLNWKLLMCAPWDHLTRACKFHLVSRELVTLYYKCLSISYHHSYSWVHRLAQNHYIRVGKQWIFKYYFLWALGLGSTLWVVLIVLLRLGLFWKGMGWFNFKVHPNSYRWPLSHT